MATEEKKSESLLSRFKRVRISAMSSSSSASSSDKKAEERDPSPLHKRQTPEKKKRSSTTPSKTPKGRSSRAALLSSASATTPTLSFSPFRFPSPLYARERSDSSSSLHSPPLSSAAPSSSSSSRPSSALSSSRSLAKTPSRPSSPARSTHSSPPPSKHAPPPSPLLLSSTHHPAPPSPSLTPSSSRPSSSHGTRSSSPNSRSSSSSLSLRPQSPSMRPQSPNMRPQSPNMRPQSPSSGRRPTPEPDRSEKDARDRRSSFSSPRASSPSRRSIVPLSTMAKKPEIPNVKEIVEAIEVLKDSKTSVGTRRDAIGKLNDILDEDSGAVQQRLRVLLRPMEDQLQKEVEISKDVCTFLQNLARIQVQDNLNPSYIYFATQIMNHLLALIAAGNSNKRDFFRATLDRLVDFTRTKDTLNILLCHRHIQHPSPSFLVELSELILRAVQNWGAEFLKSSTVINMLVAPLSALVQSKIEKVQVIAIQCVKQLAEIAPIFDSRVTERLPFHLKIKITGKTDTAPKLGRKSTTTTGLRKTPKKTRLMDFKKPSFLEDAAVVWYP